MGENEQPARLSEQQYVVLVVLNRLRRAAVCGFAGSGRTMLASEKATRHARPGFRVVSTCFIRPLAAELQSRLKQTTTLDVYYFYELCTILAVWAAMEVVNTGVRIVVPSGSSTIRRPPYPLTVNWRYTRSIHKQVLKFYRGDSTPSVYGLLGRPAEVLDVVAVSRIPSDLRKLLQHLARHAHTPLPRL